MVHAASRAGIRNFAGFADNFARADNPVGAQVHGYSTLENGGLSVVSNQLANTNASVAQSNILTTPYLAARPFVQVFVPVLPTSAAVQIFFRVTGTFSTYLGVTLNGHGTLTLVDSNGGSAVFLGAGGAGSATPGLALETHLNGNQLVASYEGVVGTLTSSMTTPGDTVVRIVNDSTCRLADLTAA